jgi:hypothetical protein
MEKGINLSLTKSLVDFDELLDKAIAAVPDKKLSAVYDPGEDSWRVPGGKYVKINIEEEEDFVGEPPLFWVGFGWRKNVKRESHLWLEFDAKSCPAKYWEKIKNLVGTSGKYYREIDIEFSQVYMNSWIHFFLKEEYLKQFYDENGPSLEAQKEILIGFISEALSKI